MSITDRVYVNRTGDKVWSPNTKEQLCEAVEELSGAVRALTAQRDAALRLHHAGHDDVADRLGIDPYPGDVCVECGSTFPCSTVAALAGGGQ